MHHGAHCMSHARQWRYIGGMSERAPRQNITALFDHPSAAQDAVTALTDAGFDKDNVRLQPGAAEDVLSTERNQDPDLVYRGFMPSDKGLSLGFVVGFLGGGLFGLMLGSGALELMGKEPAMAVGPFWSAVIGAVVLGLAGAFGGYVFNAPLPAPEPPQGDNLRHAFPTIVTVNTTDADAQRAREALQRSSPASVTVWQADNGDWVPLAAG